MKIKRYSSFIVEADETPIKEIIETCEDITLGLDLSRIKTKILCHKLGLIDPKYLIYQ